MDVIGAVIPYTEKARGAADKEDQVRSGCNMPSAVRLLQLGYGGAARLLVLLDVVESFFKLGNEWSFARGETVAAHDAPEIIAFRPLVPVVHSHDIFGRSGCH